MFQWNPGDTDITEPRKVTECCVCGDDICEGDSYFHIEEDGNYCINCMMDLQQTAEFNDGEGDNADLEYDDGIAFEQNANRLEVEMGGGDIDEL